MVGAVAMGTGVMTWAAIFALARQTVPRRLSGAAVVTAFSAYSLSRCRMPVPPHVSCLVSR